MKGLEPTHIPDIVMPDISEALEIHMSIGGIIPMDLDLGRDEPMTRDEYISMVGEHCKDMQDMLINGRCISPDVRDVAEGFIKCAIELLECSLSVKGFEELKTRY